MDKELILDFKRKLEINIANKYNDFEQDNENKKKQHEVSFSLIYVNDKLFFMNLVHVWILADPRELNHQHDRLWDKKKCQKILF